MSGRQRATGHLGEELAAVHLQRLGFKILARNVRTAAGEIDLVAGDGVTLAFVEVKTTLSAPVSRVPPAACCAAGVLERLGQAQRRRLRGLALDWLRAQPPGARRGEQLRFDAIGVVVDPAGSLLALEHLEGAW